MSKAEIVYGKPGELEEISTVAKQVFSVDFPSVVPRLYGENAHTEAYHHLIREDGVLKSIVCSYPYDFYAGGKHLSANCIGTVSVTEDRRGFGYMTDLIHHALADMEKEGVDFSVLGGQRQRYGHFGYEIVDDSTYFAFTTMSLRHCEDRSVHRQLTSVPASEYPGAAGILAPMHRRLPVYAERPEEEFLVDSSSYGGLVMMLLDGDRPVGYYVLTGDRGCVHELYLEEGYTAEEFIRHAVPLHEGKLNACLSEYQPAEFRELYRLSEYWFRDSNLNVNVLNYKHVIEAFAALKAQDSSLPDGEFAFCDTERGAYRITVKDGVCSVTECGASEAEITLPHLQSQEMLFSNMRILYDGALSGFAKALLPITIYFPSVDKV